MRPECVKGAEEKWCHWDFKNICNLKWHACVIVCLEVREQLEGLGFYTHAGPGI